MFFWTDKSTVLCPWGNESTVLCPMLPKIDIFIVLYTFDIKFFLLMNQFGRDKYVTLKTMNCVSIPPALITYKTK